MQVRWFVADAALLSTLEHKKQGQPHDEKFVFSNAMQALQHNPHHLPYLVKSIRVKANPKKKFSPAQAQAQAQAQEKILTQQLGEIQDEIQLRQAAAAFSLFLPFVEHRQPNVDTFWIVLKALSDSVNAYQLGLETFAHYLPQRVNPLLPGMQPLAIYSEMAINDIFRLALRLDNWANLVQPQSKIAQRCLSPGLLNLGNLLRVNQDTKESKDIKSQNKQFLMVDVPLPCSAEKSLCAIPDLLNMLRETFTGVLVVTIGSAKTSAPQFRNLVGLGPSFYSLFPTPVIGDVKTKSKTTAGSATASLAITTKATATSAAANTMQENPLRRAVRNHLLSQYPPYWL